MDTWLKNALELTRRSFGSAQDIDYKLLTFVFYEHFSDRNLSEFIGLIHGFHKMKVYFEIGNILAQDFNQDEVSRLTQLLKQNGLDKWAASDGMLLN